MRRKVPAFHLQKTESFPEGAPQREEYDSDHHYERACRLYEAEWLAAYECGNPRCKDSNCPQHYGYAERDLKKRKGP